MSSANPKNDRPVSSTFIATLLLCALSGAAGGAIGMLLVSAYVMPAATPAIGASVPSRVAVPTQENIPSVNPARSVVLFFDRKPAKDDPSFSLLPSAAFGEGFVLTSDGWLLAHAGSFPKGRDPKAAFADVGGKIFPVTAAITDPFSGVVFLKIDAVNLPVTAFGGNEDFAPGSLAFAFDALGDLRRVDIGSYGYPAAASPADLLASTERMQKVIRLSDADGLLPGTMILSRAGEIAGMVAGQDANGMYAVPLAAFSGEIGGVLRDGVAARPIFGAHYVDLSRLVGVSVRGNRGALLTGSSDGKVPAVAAGSPAGRAGLVSGDVITAVNGEDVSSKIGLSDLLAEYAPGSTVTLTVSGTAGERTVDLRLGPVSAR